MSEKKHYLSGLQKIFAERKNQILRKDRDRNILQEIINELNHLSKPSEMPRRIELGRQALKMISKENEPETWGDLHNDLACCLVKNPIGPYAENIEEAIRHFDEALEVRTRQKYPTEWAITQDNLGTAYRDRIFGDRAANIEQAIYLYEQALEVRTRETDPARWAKTQRNLADAFYVRICRKRVENLEQAIRYAKQALEVYTYTHELFRYDWAQTQNTLGKIYRNRIRESRKKNIEQAIQHFNQALTVLTRETFPLDWAMLQQNLGTAYIIRIEGVQAENIEWAIHHFHQGLIIYTRDAFPQDWASLQFNLGTAYSHRIRGDRTENIEQSIAYFQQALEVRTRQTFPEHWARTQNELGNAYLGRIRDEREKNADKAIDHYQRALEVYTRQTFPEDWARACNNLGNAFLARIDGAQINNIEQLENVKQAIFQYEQALTVRTSDTFPEDWAETQSNLAGAERIRASEEDIEKAIKHLKLVLAVYTREAFPQYWARTHNNLALIYANRKRGGPEENSKQAIRHYQKALEIYTIKDFPEDCLKTARGLGKLAFDGQLWDLARDAYDKVLMAQDILMHSALSPASEKAELYEIQNLPPRAAYAHIKLGDMKQAVEVLEKGRAQLLRESFELQKKNLKRLSALGFENLYNDYMQARDKYEALQNIKTSEAEHPVEWKEVLGKVKAAAAAIREKVGQSHPEYRYFLQSLPFAEIQKLGHERPLAYLCATSAGGFVLVVSGQGVEVMEIPELEQEALQKQIWRPSNEEIDRINTRLKLELIEPEDVQAVKGGFFSMYALWKLTPYLTKISKELRQQLFAAWIETLDETAQWLWNTVMGKLLPMLKEHGPSAVLIPTGQLAWLPLHAAWEKDPSKSTQRYLLDELSISYTPSAHILRQASLAIQRPTERLMAVDNPDGSLLFSKDEVHAALDVFKHNKHLQGKGATIEAVIKEMQNAHVLHFATHSISSWEKAEQALLKLADGNLNLQDIFALDLNQSRLAILSACETGVPSLELPDEVIGLPSWMMQSGVPGVVGSLWPVSDRSTALLMARFYRFWRKEGKTPQEALRHAQIWLRDKLIKFSSPYYWAAFTYTGV